MFIEPSIVLCHVNKKDKVFAVWGPGLLPDDKLTNNNTIVLTLYQAPFYVSINSLYKFTYLAPHNNTMS